MAKISICLFLLRLLGDAVAKKRKWFLYILITILFLYNSLDVITLFVQCRPAERIWNRKAPGSCWKPDVQVGFAYMQGGALVHTLGPERYHPNPSLALSIFSAFALSAFPILIVKDLQMNLQTKIAICLLMGLGIV